MYSSSVFAVPYGAIASDQNLPWFRISNLLPGFGKHRDVSSRGGGQSVHFIHSSTPMFCSAGREQIQAQEQCKSLRGPFFLHGNHPPQHKVGVKLSPHDPVTFDSSLCCDRTPRGPENRRPQQIHYKHVQINMVLTLKCTNDQGFNSGFLI